MIKDILKHNLGAILLGLIALILYFNGCFKPTPVTPIITVVRDTIWIHHDSTVISKPTVIQVNPPQIPSTYKPDTTYDGILKQYNVLLQNHFSQKIVTDTLHIDTLGIVSTIDTIQHNDLIGRKWQYHLKERQITNTVTITQPYKPPNQVFLGGKVEISPDIEVGGGLLFRNKRDGIIGVMGTYDFHRVGVELQYYKLIKLRR